MTIEGVILLLFWLLELCEPRAKHARSKHGRYKFEF